MKITHIDLKSLKSVFACFLLGVSSFVSAQNYQWQSVSMGGGGFVSAIITSKQEANLMYARTDVGGAYKWDATKKSWESLLDWVSVEETGYLGVEALAIDPQATNKLYMLVGISYFNSGKSAILRSSDYGKTFSIIDVTSKFKAHGNGMGRQNGERLVVDPNNSNILFCGTRENGLFKSADAGNNWSQISTLPVSTTPNGNGICFVILDPASGTKGNPSQTIIVGVSKTGTNFYISKNGGTSFEAVTGGPTSLMPQRAVFTGDGHVLITYANGAGPHGNSALTTEPMSTGQIWKYNIANGSWTNITPASTTFPYGGISVDPNNPKRIIASTTNVYWTQYPNVWGDRFFLSTDGGANWRDLVGSGIDLDPNGVTWISGHSIHWAGSIEFNPFNTNQAWVTSGNGVFLCEDLSAAKTTWKFNVKGLEETVPLDIVSLSNGPMVSVIGDYDGFVHSDIATYAPIHTPRIGTTTGLAFGELGNTSLMVRVGDEMFYSTNKGTSWTKTPTNKGRKGRVAVAADAQTILHCPEYSSTTYYSIDKGSNWIACNGLNVSDAVPVADPVNPNKFYAYDQQSKAFYRSTDGGKTFTTSLQLNDWGSKILRMVPGKEGDIWFAGNWDGLKRSTNSGQSFTKLSSVQECSAVGFGKAAPGKAFPTVFIWGKVNNVVGVFRSIDEGASWTRVNDDEHEYGGPGNGQFVVGDMNIFGRVYMSTAGRGIAVGDIVGPVTTLEEQMLNSEVERIAHVYPNPFLDMVHISASSNFKYTITDMGGRIVEQGCGSGSTNGGQSLLQGLYILKIEAETATNFLKIVKR